MPITRSASKRSQPTEPASDQSHAQKRVKADSPTPQTSIHVSPRPPFPNPAILRSCSAAHHAFEQSEQVKPTPRRALHRIQPTASAKAHTILQQQRQRRNRIRRLIMLHVVMIAAQLMFMVASAPEEFGFDMEEEEEEGEEETSMARTREETPGTPTPLPPQRRITSKNLGLLVREKGNASPQARLQQFLTGLMNFSDNSERKGWGGNMVNERRNIESIADTVEREFIAENI
ncbi:hypothetical protein G7Y79_00025g058060 [Physcia stellaris]|nr:hypothetical protein G7Y79_00025g058060 [Physcia stellaris]